MSEVTTNTAEDTIDSILAEAEGVEKTAAPLTEAQQKFQTAFGGKAAAIAATLDTFSKYHGKAYLSEDSVDAMQATLLNLVYEACDGLRNSIRKPKAGKPVVNFF